MIRHGMAKTPIYYAWCTMIARCTNPNHEAWANYGGRGITVCDRWRDFAKFYADMGDRPRGMSIDRIDNNLGYSPENCRWATRAQQSRNRRGRLVVRIGDTEKTLAEWADESPLALGTIWARLKKGRDPAEAVFGAKRTRKDGQAWGAENGVRWSDPTQIAA